MSADIPASRYPFAELLAERVPVEGQDIDRALADWLDGYRETTRGRYCPCVEEAQAAEAVLEQRLAGLVPAPPPSSSSAAWPRLPEMVRGVPRRRRS